MSGMLIMPIEAGNPPQYTVPAPEDREIQRKYRQICAHTDTHIERILRNMVTERRILITVNREKHACICRLHLASDNDLDYIPRKNFTISTALGASSVGWETIKGIQSSVLVLCTSVHFTNFKCICLVVNIIQKDLSKFPSVQSPIAAICLHIHYSIELCAAQISCSYIARWANKSCFSFRSPTRLLSSSQSMSLTWRSWKRRWT